MVRESQRHGGRKGFPPSPPRLPRTQWRLSRPDALTQTSCGTCLAEPAGVPRTRPVPVAFVLSSFDPGGTERQMIELLRRLDRTRWSIHLVCFRKTGAWFERAAEAAVSV